ncbi:hypothetical protein BACT_1106 [Bifidobacterium actinocoloniiforme DSM 22766]|uniref:Uncharacterized protein n=1 Tax=Bifidobacterium actinocoloniiforme DSM 22766 TaxID=1437605 RepID=A0A086Z1K4_9BIFI|nr:hypothetical protein [Bifidobacterium actinocoloniiforme]AKV55536.1 hypothetical protein AB656_04130 [Bifidobacterium actinocoloniiforme DSM 22766]KFI40404.1 hypothetical protein BACT_1106 [Bifidobacterium actinocoloniiforme DSM 22766]
MGVRLIGFQVRRTLRSLERADTQLTGLWSALKNSDQREVRELSNGLLRSNTKDLADDVRDIWELVRKNEG